VEKLADISIRVSLQLQTSQKIKERKKQIQFVEREKREEIIIITIGEIK